MVHFNIREIPSITCTVQIMNQFGIIVFGHRRKQNLLNVLESLKRQNVLSVTHVWIDGFSHAQELKEQVEDCQSLRIDFPQTHWQFHFGRLGIEKLMLDGLSFMARQYEKIIVLEDDCFPTSNAISVFLECLTEIENDQSVYSVYGHHFETPNEGRMFSRFQGWGWATTRKKLIPILSQLKAMFMMSEEDYLTWVASALSPEITAKLDVTPGRDVIKVLNKQFSWDSATVLLTAILGLTHFKTSKRVIYNCGIGANSGHFYNDSDFLRQSPFNMIGADEVWQYFNCPIAAQYKGAKYFGLNELDRKIAEYIPQQQGVFVDVGANDGINQSNSLYFERQGWRGVLIEPVPATYEKCQQNRPLAQVVHAACVAPDYPDTEIVLVDVGLMSLVEGARNSEEEKQAWIQRGEQLQQITSKPCTAPAKTLTSILEEQNLKEIDLLLVDVEGYESEVLAGLDFSRFRPKHIVIEDSGTTDLESILGKSGYEVIAVFNERNFTRDLLFRDQQKGNGQVLPVHGVQS
jgi:FkbM family methyltransferase